MGWTYLKAYPLICLVPGQAWLRGWSSHTWSVCVAGLPYNMAALGWLDIFLLAQVPRDACSSEQAGSCSTFCDPAQEVTHHLFCCVFLVETVTDLLIFKGRGVDQGAVCCSWRDGFLLLLYWFSGCGFGFPEDGGILPSEFTLSHLS